MLILEQQQKQISRFQIIFFNLKQFDWLKKETSFQEQINSIVKWKTKHLKIFLEFKKKIKIFNFTINNRCIKIEKKKKYQTKNIENLQITVNNLQKKSINWKEELKKLEKVQITTKKQKKALNNLVETTEKIFQINIETFKMEIKRHLKHYFSRIEKIQITLEKHKNMFMKLKKKYISKWLNFKIKEILFYMEKKLNEVKISERIKFLQRRSLKVLKNSTCFQIIDIFLNLCILIYVNHYIFFLLKTKFIKDTLEFFST